MERLQKLIAAAGFASRREAEKLIAAGKVQVNGETVTKLGTQADPTTDSITVNGKKLAQPHRLVYALNKPRGVVTSRARQAKERIVTDLVPASPAVYPVGRLDKDSEGLLLLTNDGTLAQRLTHPSFEHQKVYEVTAEWRTYKENPDGVLQKLKKGVKLGDGLAKADSARLLRQKENEIRLEITLHEGRTHIVRRMCAAVGLKVTRLIRVKIGTIELENITSGKYRLLTDTERSALLA